MRNFRPSRFRGTPERPEAPASARAAVAGAGKKALRDKRHLSAGKAFSDKSPRLYGRHAVLAALANPARTLRRLSATREALALLEKAHVDLAGLDIRTLDAAQLDALVREAPHQGLVLDVDALPDLHIEEALPQADVASGPILVLDQVTDPHNVGAILRSAAAFGAAFIVTQDRHSPPETGALAKAASGALEIVPWVRAVNLARALEAIAAAGYWRIGLDGAQPLTLADALSGERICLVLGAEGAGLRQNVAAHCDALAKLPISSRIDSLNVSTAAAVALYAVSQSLALP